MSDFSISMDFTRVAASTGRPMPAGIHRAEIARAAPVLTANGRGVDVTFTVEGDTVRGIFGGRRLAALLFAVGTPRALADSIARRYPNAALPTLVGRTVEIEVVPIPRSDSMRVAGVARLWAAAERTP